MTCLLCQVFIGLKSITTSKNLAYLFQKAKKNGSHDFNREVTENDSLADHSFHSHVYTNPCICNIFSSPIIKHATECKIVDKINNAFYTGKSSNMYIH